jgi:cytochrome c peroxidase
VGASVVLVLTISLLACSESDRDRRVELATWSPAELELLRSLSLGSLPPLPKSLSNRVADEPRASRMGERLFFDPGLSRTGEISCASCHVPTLHFTDGRTTSAGLGRGQRNAPSVVGASYGSWFFWDGRRDSLWAQALAPMETPTEMGSTRLEIARRATTHPRYAEDYRELFGPAPDFADATRFPPRASPYGDGETRAAWLRLSDGDRAEIDEAFSNVGKAIEAYERRLLPGPSRFDRYVERLSAGGDSAAAPLLDADEIAGLRLFVDGARTQCLRCHNGPLLTNHSFHHVATGRGNGAPDLGRYLGIQSLLLDAFNCLGAYSDAPPGSCQELRFLSRRELVRESGAFKTPTLREVARTGPYFHDGRFAQLEQVLAHYRNPPEDPSSELTPLALSDLEARQLIAFLTTLSGGVSVRQDP